MKKYRLIPNLMLSAVLAASAVSPVQAAGKSPAEFDQWMEDEFIESMEDDYMTMHYTVKDYRKLGIEKGELTIGEAEDAEDYAENVKDAEDTLKELAEFDYDALSDTQKHDYDTIKNYVQRTMELNQYPLFDFYFLPTSGIIDNLLTNFTEFVFYEKEDIDDYLSVVSSVPKYIDEALEITKTQAASGYFLTDSALDQTKEAIQRFTSKTEDNELIVIFNKNVDAFEGLSDAEKEAYKTKNKDIIINSYIPAYQKAARELESLRGSRKSQKGVSDLLQGKEYYEALAKFKTSTDLPVESLLQICDDYLTAVFPEFYMYASTADDSVWDAKVSFTEPEEILSYLQKNLTEDFPAGPEVTFKASYLDPSVANDGIVAYYLNPPVDDIKDNVIRINGSKVEDANAMFETLAHEGFPGHCYQITWFMNTQPAHLRSVLSNIGYTEGWAMYTEDWCWSVSGLRDDAANLSRLNTGISYVLNAAADLGVNGLGWDVNQLAKWIEKKGFNSEMASGLYDFVIDDPGVILPYGVGLAQFMRLKRKAEKYEGFDLKAFNEVLLKYGDRPFEIVESDVDAYLKSLGGDVPETTPTPGTDITPTPEVTPQPADDSGEKWLLYGGIGALALALVIIVLALNTHRKANR